MIQLQSAGRRHRGDHARQVVLRGEAVADEKDTQGVAAGRCHWIKNNLMRPEERQQVPRQPGTVPHSGHRSGVARRS